MEGIALSASDCSNKADIDPLVKGLSLKHLKNAQNILSRLSSAFESNKTVGGAVEVLYESIPQLYIHIGFALRLVIEPVFPSLISQLKNTASEVLNTFNLATELRNFEEFKKNERFLCDFSRNDVLSAEKIIRSGFYNSKRKIYQKIPYLESSVYEEAENADFILKRLESEVPVSLKKFNEAKVGIYETPKFNRFFNKEKWISGLSTSRWYGPFKCPDANTICFATATKEGQFDGLLFKVSFHAKLKSIQVFYQGHNGTAFGIPQTFTDI